MDTSNSITNPAGLLDLQLRIEIEEKLPIAAAGILANDALNHFLPAVREGVLLWMDDKLTDDFAVEGINLGSLRRGMALSPFFALYAMNMMIAEPDSAYTLRWFTERA